MTDTILVAGGAGFIGSNFIAQWIAHAGGTVVNLDKLTYAGNLNNLNELKGDKRHVFVKGDIADRNRVRRLLARYRPRAIINFAAETHVDRSIQSPDGFIHTNIVGTFSLLEEARQYFAALGRAARSRVRFVQVSTDEVYGSLEVADPASDENAPLRPTSPYAAAKAGADLLVGAYYKTYGLPTIVTSSSNNYGPYQYPEKLIPLVILNAIRGCELPIYGDGGNIRDWLYIDDHCSALRAALAKGLPGSKYNIGGENQRSNLETVRLVCEALDQMRPRARGSYRDLIRFVADRRGHDFRYALDIGKAAAQLGWKPSESFPSGIRKTVRWYLDNQSWVEQVIGHERYRSWVAVNYANRSTR